MDFEHSEHAMVLQTCLRNFMQHHVLPANDEWLQVADFVEKPCRNSQRFHVSDVEFM